MHVLVGIELDLQVLVYKSGFMHVRHCSTILGM